MNFSIVATIHRLLAPQHELSISWLTWYRLIAGLRRSGRGFRRESGAFLLGRRSGMRARIVSFVLYDDLDPSCLDSGIVRLDGRHFGALWDECRRRNLMVVADVHTHPGSSEQSDSDRANPIISTGGEIALIVPRFAAGPVRRSEIGIFRYQGGKRWQIVPPERHQYFLHIGL